MSWKRGLWLKPESWVKQPSCTLVGARGCWNSKTLRSGDMKGTDLAWISRLDQFICSLAGLNRITWMWLLWLLFFPAHIIFIVMSFSAGGLLTQLFCTICVTLGSNHTISLATRGCLPSVTLLLIYWCASERICSQRSGTFCRLFFWPGVAAT